MIDLNTASADTLDGIEMLRGHGFEIVRYREERGRFTSLRQLDEVPGLSGKKNTDLVAQMAQMAQIPPPQSSAACVQMSHWTDERWCA